MVILVSLLSIACLICNLTLKVYICSSLQQFVSTVLHYFAGKNGANFQVDDLEDICSEEKAMVCVRSRSGNSNNNVLAACFLQEPDARE